MTTHMVWLRFAILVGTLTWLPSGLWSQFSLPFQPRQHHFVLPPQATVDDMMPGRAIVKVKEEFRHLLGPDGLQHPHLDILLPAIEAQGVVRTFPFATRPDEVFDAYGRRMADLSLICQVDFHPDAPVVDVVNLLYETGLFEYAEPSYVYRSFYDPDDPDTASQYYLALMHARQAWDISKGDTSVVIGIVDTGTSFTHPDLASEHHLNHNDPIDGIDNDNDGYVDNYRGWDLGGDFWNSPGDNDPTWNGAIAGSDHGVIVGGAAAAATDNGVNIASVGFKCRLLPVKVSINQTPLIYYGYQGVVYAADHGADIINLSWGGGLRSKMGGEAIRYAAVNKGKAIVASAGNTPVDYAIFPASYPEVISCAGTQQNDAVWLTNPSFGTTYNYMVDVCAPSRDVKTTTNNLGTYSATGTSLGSPLVAAVAGLVMADNPSLSPMQALQRARVSADQNFYNLNPASYAEKMGRGRADALAALTDASPSVRVVDIAYDAPGDGLIQAGDTIDVRVRFINYLNPVQDLSIDLTTPDWGQIEVLHGEVYAGDMGTLDTVSTWLAPFKVVIRAGTPAGFFGRLRFGFEGNGYSDYEYYALEVEQSYVNADANRIETSLTSQGRIGYTAFPALNRGKGLIIDAAGGFINDAGFMIGTGPGNVSSNFEAANGSGANDFQNLVPIRREVPGPLSDLYATTTYNDQGAGANALGVTIRQNTYQFDHPTDDNYLIQEYKIVNDHPTDTLHDAFAGMYMDMDFFWRSNNVSVYDPVSRTIYNDLETFVSLWQVGFSLLTADSLHGFASQVDSFGYTLPEKWLALTSPPTDANLANVNLIQFASAGPFSIAPGDTHTVAFALLVGDSLSHLRESRQRAHDKYWCVIRGGMSPQTDLGPDIDHCGADTSFLLDAGAGYSSYLWQDGSTGSTLIADSSGSYWVQVTDANGCVDHDRVEITIGEGITGGFTCAPTVIWVGDTVTFTDTTSNAIEWGWDFGDGSTECPIQSTVRHSFAQPGTYTVQMIVGNGICQDTVTKLVQVDSLVAIDAPQGWDFQLYPNPSQGMVRLQAQDLNGQSVVRVLDLRGQLLLEQELVSQGQHLDAELDLRGLARGTYLVYLRAADGWTVVKKLVLN